MQKQGHCFFQGHKLTHVFKTRIVGANWLSACSDNLDFFRVEKKWISYHKSEKKTSGGNTERNQGCQKFQVQTLKNLRRWHQKKTPPQKYHLNYLSSVLPTQLLYSSPYFMTSSYIFATLFFTIANFSFWYKWFYTPISYKFFPV